MTTINLRDGLEVLYYFGEQDFDPQRNQLQDHSGYGRHATANGGPTVGVEGPASFEATAFDGSDDRFDVPFDIDERPLSVMAIARPINQDANRPIISATRYGDTRGDDGGYALSFGHGGFGQEEIIFSTGDQSDNTASARTEYNAGQWYTAIGVDDGSNISLAVNGETEDTSDSSPVNSIESFRDTRIGETSDGSMLGPIATVAVWQRALSDAEIQYLNNLTAPLRAQL